MVICKFTDASSGIRGNYSRARYFTAGDRGGGAKKGKGCPPSSSSRIVSVRKGEILGISTGGEITEAGVHIVESWVRLGHVWVAKKEGFTSRFHRDKTLQGGQGYGKVIPNGKRMGARAMSVGLFEAQSAAIGVCLSSWMGPGGGCVGSRDSVDGSLSRWRSGIKEFAHWRLAAMWFLPLAVSFRLGGCGGGRAGGARRWMRRFLLAP